MAGKRARTADRRASRPAPAPMSEDVAMEVISHAGPTLGSGRRNWSEARRPHRTNDPCGKAHGSSSAGRFVVISVLSACGRLFVERRRGGACPPKHGCVGARVKPGDWPSAGGAGSDSRQKPSRALEDDVVKEEIWPPEGPGQRQHHLMATIWARRWRDLLHLVRAWTARCLSDRHGDKHDRCGRRQHGPHRILHDVEGVRLVHGRGF